MIQDKQTIGDIITEMDFNITDVQKFDEILGNFIGHDFNNHSISNDVDNLSIEEQNELLTLLQRIN